MSSITKRVLKQIITFLIITSVLTLGTYFWMFNSSKVNAAMTILMMWIPAISAI